MGIEQIRNIKQAAGEPKIKKVYTIPKVSKKKKKQEAEHKALAEADKLFYLEIWQASPHKCFECGISLPKEPLNLFFHHLLPKRLYPQFRHTEENIAILCPDCHSQAETDLDKVKRTKQRTIEVKKILLAE